MPITHVVVQGECLSAIAQRYGFRNYRTLYDHPANARLRRARPNPNVLFPGDRIVIPDRTRREHDVPTARGHQFRVHSSTKVFRVRLQASDGRALAGAPYVLELDDGSLIEGKTTAADGSIEHPVPPATRRVVLHVEGRVLELACGSLNPAAETGDDGVTGIQARLRNLGYDPGPVDGVLGRRTRGALALFQADAGLRITGRLDATTRQAIERDHGS
jgi:N-acetylmuramoyl-L-alanine amidase